MTVVDSFPARVNSLFNIIISLARGQREALSSASQCLPRVFAEKGESVNTRFPLPILLYAGVVIYSN